MDNLGLLSAHAVPEPLQLSFQSCRLSFHIISLLPHPSNMPSLLLIKEKPEQPFLYFAQFREVEESHQGSSAQKLGDLEDLTEATASNQAMICVTLWAQEGR